MPPQCVVCGREMVDWQANIMVDTRPWGQVDFNEPDPADIWNDDWMPRGPDLLTGLIVVCKPCTMTLVGESKVGDVPARELHAILDLMDFKTGLAFDVMFSAEGQASFIWSAQARRDFERLAQEGGWLPLADALITPHGQPEVALTPIEAMFWKVARDKIPGLIAQHPVGGYRVDFALPHWKIAIELDGHEYHKTKSQRTYDARRERALQRQGWRVIRYTGSEVYHDAARCVEDAAHIIQQWTE